MIFARREFGPTTSTSLPRFPGDLRRAPPPFPLFFLSGFTFWFGLAADGAA
jgi:hypothetical protein